MNSDLNHERVIWVHGDCLRPGNPALRARPDAPAIFCWDDELLREWRISFKRVLFIYECLLEMPVTIRRGDVAGEVAAFAAEHGATGVVTAFSPSPRFGLIAREIEKSYPIEVLPEDPFLDYPGEFDLRRFSRFWRQAESYAYRGGEQLNLW